MAIKTSNLKSQKAFSILNAEELESLCKDGVEQSYHKGEFMIREGSVNRFLFFIVSGEVHIKSYGVKVAKLSSGSLLGEVSATGVDAPIADAIAAGSVNVYKFPVQTINKIAEKNTSFGSFLHEKAMARVLR